MSEEKPLDLFSEYHNYTRLAGCPTSYHDWVLLSMISAVVGKKLWIPCNYFKAYPNLYVILVSPPGVGMKSSAMRMGRSTVQLAEAPVQFCHDNATPQALQIEMVDSYSTFEVTAGKFYGSSALTVIASELVTLLSAGPPMVEFLTDIFDSDTKFEYKTKNKGCLEIVNPCLNIIAGATTETFCSRIIKDAVAGGFMSRSIIVYDNAVNTSSPLQMPEDDMIESQRKVAARLAEISKLYGEVKFTPEAKQKYEAWHLGEKPEASGMNVSFHSRKHIHILKVAMLLAAADLTRLISLDHMTRSMELIERIEHNMKFIYMSAGANKQSEVHLRILVALNSAGGEIDYKDLLAHFMKDVTQEELEKVIETLEKVQYLTQQHKGKDRIICLTEKARATLSTYKK